MKIVGVGAGPKMLTEEAIKAIECANVVCGSARAIELAKAHIRGEVRVLTNFDAFAGTEDVCVLSTGDPMLSGLGKKAPNNAEIISGISSLQLACARQKIDIADTLVISTHGRNPTESQNELKRVFTLGRMLFVLPDPGFDLGKICGFLDACGYKGDVVLFEDLGYERERITVGSIQRPPERTSNLFCALINPKISHLAANGRQK
jgi:cobalt-precorrin-7 (C5)-methyltransferase